MIRKLFNRQKKAPSPRLVSAYQRLYIGLNKLVRTWETQSVQHRKVQLIFGFIGLLLIGSLSVYFTATGHFFTRINQKYNEQQPSFGSLRWK